MLKISCWNRLIVAASATNPGSCERRAQASHPASSSRPRTPFPVPVVLTSTARNPTGQGVSPNPCQETHPRERHKGRKFAAFVLTLPPGNAKPRKLQITHTSYLHNPMRHGLPVLPFNLFTGLHVVRHPVYTYDRLTSGPVHQPAPRGKDQPAGRQSPILSTTNCWPICPRHPPRAELLVDEAQIALRPIPGKKPTGTGEGQEPQTARSTRSLPPAKAKMMKSSLMQPCVGTGALIYYF